jgi:hypothetical protein
MQRRALLGLAATSMLGCGPRPIGAPPSAPALVSASDVIPPDLDVVVRFDLGRVKSALGASVLSGLSREVLSAAGGAEHTDELVLESLVDAEIVYLG